MMHPQLLFAWQAPFHAGTRPKAAISVTLAAGGQVKAQQANILNQRHIDL
jgi:hypothetical protein